ncbi:hypothetical protein DL93DRAFT_2092213 [Clavulina sp. PMI_390]|nr:hypothetical protein DL93DRAFT_2092213 [Clavulina sp. PMI_390]
MIGLTALLAISELQSFCEVVRTCLKRINEHLVNQSGYITQTRGRIFPNADDEAPNLCTSTASQSIEKWSDC